MTSAVPGMLGVPDGSLGRRAAPLDPCKGASFGGPFPDQAATIVLTKVPSAPLRGTYPAIPSL